MVRAILIAGLVLVGAACGSDESADHVGCSVVAEEFPTRAPVGPVVAAYSSADPERFVVDVLAERYPFGAALAKTDGGACIRDHLGNLGSAATVARQVPLVVHECGHRADAALSSAVEVGYRLPDAVLRCPLIESAPRSRILGDGFESRLPPCPSEGPCDPLAAVYLQGAAGQGGLERLVGELHQYTNSLAAAWAVADLGEPVPERDSAVITLWYLDRYLTVARQDPTLWAGLQSDACWRGVVLRMAERAEQHLTWTRGAGLGQLDEVALGLFDGTREARAALRSVHCEDGLRDLAQ